LKLSLRRDAAPLAGLTATRSEVAHIYEDTATGYTLSAEDFSWTYAPRPYLYFDHGRRITDKDALSTQPEWEALNTYHVPSGQVVVLAPVKGNIPEGAVYTWTVDNAVIDHTGEVLSRSFAAASSLVKVRVQVDAVTHASASTLVKAGSYAPGSGSGAQAQATCLEFSPAPGQFVGKGNGFSNPRILDLASYTEERVRDFVQGLIDGEDDGWNNFQADGKVLSLGGWGGYYIFRFDHSVPNTSGPDVGIPSNNHTAGMQEAGVVWVSRDVNGDGKPNEIWYQLKGSQSSPAKGYAMVYFKPKDASSALWIDNRGGAGTFPYYSNGNDGYPYHITESSGTYVMFTGTLLQDSDLTGYVDAGVTTFDLDDAVDGAGNPVNLTHIDFVKVQTGLNKHGGGLGEYSTEAGIPEDLHFGK
jgi:hypothetical protein